jgi:hypothetical protein
MCGKIRRERVEVALTVETMVKTRHRWFVPEEERPVDCVARIVYQIMEGSQITRGRPRKTIMKDFEINELDIEI